MVDYSNLATRAKAREEAVTNRIETLAEELIHIVERRIKADPNDDVVIAMLALGRMKDTDPKLLPVLTLLSGKKSAADKAIELLGGKTKSKDDDPAAPAAIASRPSNHGYADGLPTSKDGDRVLPIFGDDGNPTAGMKESLMTTEYEYHYNADGKIDGLKKKAATPAGPAHTDDPELQVVKYVGLMSKRQLVVVADKTVKRSEAAANPKKYQILVNPTTHVADRVLIKGTDRT